MSGLGYVVLLHCWCFFSQQTNLAQKKFPKEARRSISVAGAAPGKGGVSRPRFKQCPSSTAAPL